MAVGPRVPSGAAMAAKMLARLEADPGAWKAGMLAPKKDPIAAGIAAKGKHKVNTEKALAADSYAKGLAKVDRAAMESTINATPDGAVAEGVARRMDKVTAKMTKLSGILLANAAILDAMPQDTDQQRQAKMLKNLELMRLAKEKMRT